MSAGTAAIPTVLWSPSCGLVRPDHLRVKSVCEAGPHDAGGGSKVEMMREVVKLSVDGHLAISAYMHYRV